MSATHYMLSSGSRILLTPHLFGSHVSQMSIIGEALANNGHEVYIMLPSATKGLDSFKQRNLTVVGYVRQHNTMIDENTKQSMFEEFTSMTYASTIRRHQDTFMPLCTDVLSDEQLFLRLKQLQLDFAIVDAFALSRCYFVLIYRLGIPYGSMVTYYEPWLLRNPSLPSATPFSLGAAYSDHMPLMERISNTWRLMEWTLSPGLGQLDDGLVTQYAKDKPPVSLNYLASRSLIWLVNTDICIDYPRPLMPNEINIGGLTTRPARPLHEELEHFLSTSTKDAVVVTFGDQVVIPARIYAVILEAFTKIKDLNFIWRYLHTFPDNIPSNIKLMRWIPQNDLLGHPKVKLFITHGGPDGHFEALHHAVPMITLPLFGGHPYNARRAAEKGISITKDINNLQVDDFISSIN